MIFQGSLSKCVVHAAHVFKTCANTRLCICRNTRAKYYVLYSIEDLDEMDFDSPTCNVDPVFIGTERELLMICRPVIQEQLDFTRLDKEIPN